MKRSLFKKIKQRVVNVHRAVACKRARKAIPEHGCYPTALEKNIGLYGKGFAKSFQEKRIKWRKTKSFIVKMENYIPNRVVLQKEPLNVNGRHWRSIHNLAELKIGFEKNAVIVEGFAEWHNVEKDLVAFNKIAGENWANKLVGMLEGHAKRNGFERVKIRAPEILRNYEILQPYEKKERYELKKFVEFYENLAKKRGYKKTVLFFEKQLK